MSDFLGRPSAGDSPFAIGDRAMRDTSSPQPPAQRNPQPRAGQIGPGGFMTTPTPFGSSLVSNEARRRYEERYAKKRAEDEEKKRKEEEEERRKQQQQQQQQGGAPPPGPPGAYPRSPGPPGGFQQQQHQQYAGGPQPGGYAPPHAQYPSNPPYQPAPVQQQHQQPYPPPQQSQQQQYSQPPPMQQRYSNPPPLHQQNSFGGPPPHQQNQRPLSGYSSPPPMHHQQQQQQPPYQAQQSQQPHRYSAGPGPQWSNTAVPPPAQTFNQSRSPPMPQQVEDHELQQMFNQFDSSRSGALSSHDLQRLLAKDSMMDAREDCVKMLMNIFDTDKSGSINFMEFEGLYRYIQDWHGIFRRFDRDGSGLIDRKELHQALLGFGFSLPSEMVRKLEKRFTPPQQPGQPPQKGVGFDRFLMACVTVKHYTEAFRKLDPNGSGRITVDYNTYMEIVLDAPS